jgi:hypothetical protein
MKDSRETLVRKLLKELPELVADYAKLATDADGKARIKKVAGLIQKIGMFTN